MALLTRSRVILLCVAVLGAILLIGLAFRSDEAQIRRQLSELQRSLELQGDEPMLTSVSRANDTADFFAEPLSLQVGHPLSTIRNKSQLKGIIVQTRQSASLLKMQIHGMTISLMDNNKQAQIGLMVKGNVHLGRERASEFREYDMRMEKIGGEWLITSLSEAPSITDPSDVR